jgi:ABC-type uncharacterized transport system substrate-binding protein
MCAMKKARVVSILFLAVLIAVGVTAEAQQVKKIPRIGYASGVGEPNNPGRDIEAFRQGLRELGYVEGKNIVVEYRYAEGNLDRAPGFIAEFVQLKVDALVVTFLPAIRSAKQATKTIPIVMISPVDPVATGLVDSLARPGGNITGLARLTRDLSGKRLELLKELIPRLSRIGIFWDSRGPGPVLAFKEYETAARALKIPLQSLELRAPNPDLEGAFHAATKGRSRALIAILNPVVARHTKRIADLAVESRLPLMFERSQDVDAGGLMSYSANDSEIFRRASVYVDKILKGTQPWGFAGGAADQVRTDHQSENCQADRPHDSAVDAVPGGQGDSMMPRKQTGTPGLN